jgi:hypothetical protein
MKRSAALTVVTLALQAVVSFAGPPPSKEVVAPPPVSYFRPNEFDIGAFGTYGSNLHSQDNHSGIGNRAFGGGVDVAYIPWFYAGFRIQGSVIMLDPGDNTAGIVSGSFILRYPLDLRWPNFHLAPYAIAGVGGLIDGYNGSSEVDATGRVHRRTKSRVLGDFGGIALPLI